MSPFSFWKSKDSVLHDKTQWNDLHAYEALLKAHASEINAPNAKQRTPLHLAAENARADVTQLLLRYGADLEAKDKDGATPLMVAAANNRAKVARMLLKKGASVQTTNRKGETPLHAAAMGGHGSVVHALLLHDADYRAEDAKGVTPLDYVGQSVDVEVEFEDFGAYDDPNEEIDYAAVKFALQDVLETRLGYNSLDLHVVVTDEMEMRLEEAVDNLVVYDAFMKKVLEVSNGVEPRFRMQYERLEKVEAQFKKALNAVMDEHRAELELDALFETLRV